jgi:hypothetical protein
MSGPSHRTGRRRGRGQCRPIVAICVSAETQSHHQRPQNDAGVIEDAGPGGNTSDRLAVMWFAASARSGHHGARQCTT